MNRTFVVQVKTDQPLQYEQHCVYKLEEINSALEHTSANKT